MLDMWAVFNSTDQESSMRHGVPVSVVEARGYRINYFYIEKYECRRNGQHDTPVDSEPFVYVRMRARCPESFSRRKRYCATEGGLDFKMRVQRAIMFDPSG